jgi:hypothetical protein
MEKIERFNDIYIRSMAFQFAPYVFVSTGTGVKVLNSPFWTGTGNFTEGSDGKTTAWLTSAIGECSGSLTLAALAHAAAIMETNLRIPYFSGKLGADTNLESRKYRLICSGEAYQQFSFDPYLQQNKNCDLNVVSGSFKGDLFGRITSIIEDLPLHMTAAAGFEEPELRVDDSGAYNNGETLPNPQYAEIANSPYNWGFLCGQSGLDAIEVGPPPSKFTGDTPPHDFPGLFWNGEVKPTKQRLIKTLDSAGSEQWEMNTYGEYMWWISQATFGVLPKQRRNIIPILYQRKQIV